MANLSQSIKAIVVAAGRGERLYPYTNDRPKCMVEVGGKAILAHLLNGFEEAGVGPVVIVRGYKGESISFPRLTFYDNPHYDTSNILASLFCAEKELSEGFIFSYSDILYPSRVLRSLVQEDREITIVVDTCWQQAYVGRDAHPVSEAELVRVERDRVVEIRKGIDPQIAFGEFIGLAKFSPQGAEALSYHYHSAMSYRAGNAVPFHHAPSLERAYLTDMLQELVDEGVAVNCMTIEGGWVEVDVPGDLVRAERLFGKKAYERRPDG